MNDSTTLFREKLADQLSSGRSQRGTHGDFASPAGGAGQQQVADVRASDQEYEHYRSKEELQRQTDLTRDLIQERYHPYTGTLVRFGPGGGQARGDTGHLSAGD
jgi:hypothetical protein